MLPTNKDKKIQLRKKLLQKRSLLSNTLQNAASLAALDLFLKSDLFKSSKNIACYFAVNNEFNCAAFIQTIWRHHKNCYLPVVSSTNTNILEFALYNEHDKLQKNRYKILEPIHREFISTHDLDLVLLPLVAFDLNGHRLGMGGGYYDKTFAFLLDTKLPGPYLLGVAYEWQKQTLELPSETWDIRLNGVLTEKSWYQF